MAMKFNSISGQFDEVGLDKNDPLLSAAKELRVKQNPGYGEYSNIYEALTSITTSSITERYVISVAPGIYTEPELDFSSKPYVSMVGESIQSVVIKPAGTHQHIIKLGVYNEVSFIWLEDAGPGYAGIAMEDTGDYGQCHKVTFNNCDIGIKITATSVDTKFYGEYIDMNGAFTHAVKAESTGGSIAFANLENFYVFPTTTVPVTQGVYLTGTTTKVYINSCGMTGFGVGQGIYIQDGAEVNVSDVYIGNFDVGVHNDNTGSGCIIKLESLQMEDNISMDIEILHTASTGSFTGTSSHTLINNQAPTFTWSFLDIVDGEMEISNKLSITFDDGTHTDLSTLLVQGSGMGLLDGGELTPSLLGGLNVAVAAGFGYLDDTTLNVIKRFDWLDTDVALVADSDNFIFVNASGTVTSSTSSPVSLYNVIYLGKVRTNTTDVLFIDASPMIAHHTVNLLSTFNRVALGNIYYSGSTVLEGSALKLDITAGLYFRSENVFTPSGGSDITFTLFYHNGSSAWNTTTTDTLNNTDYNSGNTFTALTSGYYTKHSLYVVGEGVNEQYFVVLGQAEHSTLLDAQSDAIPTPPVYFDKGVCLIALVYVQEGNSNIVAIEDARPIIGFKPITSFGVSDHGSLTGLGNNDHPQYLLANGGSTMSGDLNLGTNSIINVNLVDGVDVSAHASRHLPNGADPLTTAAPTTNLGGSSTNHVGIQNSLSRSDHSHAVDTAGAGTTGLLTSTDWNTFNNKQDTLVSGTNIKTINSTSLVGSGNVSVEPVITAGTTLQYWRGDKSFQTLDKAAVGLGNVVNLDTSTTANVTDSTNKRFVTDANLVVLGNTSNTNTGDQTSITGITGTKAQFDTACTDGNFLYAGDVTQYTDELAQDAIGAMIDSTLVYVDGTPLLTRAALTGDVTASQGSNATTIANNVVTNAKMAQVATQTFKGRTTAGTGNPEDLTIAQAKTLLSLTGTNSGDQTITLTSDVTGSGTGSFATTIANDAVTFAKMQNISTGVLLGRSTAATGDVEELTVAGNLSLAGGVLTSTVSVSSVNAAGDITTTSATDVVATSMTLTPGAGTYVVLFNSDISHNTNAGVIQVSIYANGVIATNSQRTFIRGNQTMRVGGNTQAVVTVTAGQAIDVRWNRGGVGTGTMGNRSLILIKQ